jgi:hypothetical protein
MRVAMVVGALLFSFVSGFYELGVADPVGTADNQAVQAYDDHFPPPPSWP